MDTLKSIVISSPQVLLGIIPFIGILIKKMFDIVLCSNIDTIFYTKTQHSVKKIAEWVILFIGNTMSLVIIASAFYQCNLNYFIIFLIGIDDLAMIIIIISARIVKKPKKNWFLNIVGKEKSATIIYALSLVLNALQLSISYDSDAFRVFAFMNSMILSFYLISHIELINNLSGYVHYFFKDGARWFIHYSTSKKEVLCTNKVEPDLSDQLRYFNVFEIKEKYVINRKKREFEIKK